MGKLITIITVSFNASAVIKPTLDSIAQQTFRDFEYVVQDGASKDDTLEKIRSYGFDDLKIVSERDGGLYDAMNRAIRRATGEYLIFLNAGDAFSDAEALSRIADTIRTTNADIVYGQTQIVDDNRKIIGMRHLTAPQHLTYESFRNGMLVCHQAFIARKSIMGEYDLTYRFSADYEWCLRCLKASKKNAYTGGVLISFLDGGTTTKNHRASLKERFHIMCTYYGTLTTILHHLSFIPRYLRRKIGAKK